MSSNFATRLRALRAKAKLSQSQLARKAGFSVRTLQKLEQGQSARPTLATAQALASALGVTVERLCG